MWILQRYRFDMVCSGRICLVCIRWSWLLWIKQRGCMFIISKSRLHKLCIHNSITLSFIDRLQVAFGFLRFVKPKTQRYESYSWFWSFCEWFDKTGQMDTSMNVGAIDKTHGWSLQSLESSNLDCSAVQIQKVWTAEQSIQTKHALKYEAVQTLSG